MFQYLFYIVLLASLKHTLGSPPYKSSRDGARFEEDQEMDECFIHVRIQSCHEVMDIQLRLEGATSQVPLHELKLDISEEGNEQDVCLSVPCQSGQLTESMKLKATSVASDDFNIVVSPETLETTFGGLHYDSEECFSGMKTPADIIVTCKKKSPADDEGRQLTDVFLKSFEDDDDDDGDKDEDDEAGKLADTTLNSSEYDELRDTVLESFGDDKDDEENLKVHVQNYETWDGYNNEYDEPLGFTCGSYKAINSIKSRHNNRREDRQFGFTCHKVTSCAEPFTSCYWTGYVNRLRETLSFTCPENHILAGLYSTHNNRKEDRRWKFQCCYAENYVTKSCSLTESLNSYDRAFSFNQENRVFVGMHSRFKKRKKDRRFKITHCKYVKDLTTKIA